MSKLYVPVISDHNFMMSSWYKETVVGIKKNADRRQLRTQIFSEDIHSIDLSSLPDVIIVTGGAFEYIHTVIDALKKANKRIVFAGLDADPFGNNISCATPSRKSEIDLLFRYFYGCGKNKTALVGFRTDGINDMTRYYAALNAAAVYKSSFTDKDIFFSNSDMKTCLESFLPSAKNYQAIICPNDATSLCLINACIANNISVPDDLYVASFSNMKIGEYAKPSLTSVAMDFTTAGMQSFFVWQLMNEHADQDIIIKIQVSSKLIVRQSTGYEPLRPLSKITAIPAEDEEDVFVDKFYEDSMIRPLIDIENCLSHCDDLDMKILSGLFDGVSYEALAERYFISISTIRYRLSNIYADAGVSSRNEFETFIRKMLGKDNPFSEN